MPIFLAQLVITLQSLGAPEAVVPLLAPLKHVQGIETDGNRLWVSSVDKEAHTGHIHIFEIATGKMLRTVQVSKGEVYHPGGMAIDGKSLWVPVAEYKRIGRSVIEERDSETLELRSSFAVDDHIGCVAAGDGKIYGGNWDALKIYTWNTKGGLLEERVNPQKTHYQDMKLRGGKLVASGVVDKDSGAIDWLSVATLQLEKRVRAGKTDRNTLYTNEGMTVYGDRIYLLPEDGPSRLFVFRMSAPVTP